MKTTVVHCRKDDYDICIDRGSKFGNPFTIIKYKTRATAVSKHKEWLDEWIQNKNEITIGAWSNKWVIEHLYLLKGKVIACWCNPLACHGDYLAELADGT